MHNYVFMLNLLHLAVYSLSMASESQYAHAKKYGSAEVKQFAEKKKRGATDHSFSLYGHGKIFKISNTW